MRAIDTLTQEHEVIEKALALLENVTRRIRAGLGVPDAFAACMVQFIREFADGCHHQKEELAAFPRRRTAGLHVVRA